MFLDFLIILALILLNGLFAMTELAVVSARKSKMLALAEAKNTSAQTVLMLKENPSMFLSTVQIGITLIGILAGAYSGATLAEPVGAWLAGLGMDQEMASDIGIGLVVALVTYLSLIIGELVPKQIALRHADRVALFIALPIYGLSVVSRPLVWLLTQSNHLLLMLLRVGGGDETGVSEEEVRAIIAEGTQAGALDAEERQMLEGVMRLDDLPISVAMTHRQDIVWLKTTDSLKEVAGKIRESGHSHYLLCEEESQNVVGAISAKDIVTQWDEKGELDLDAILHQPLSLPEGATIRRALNAFRRSRVHIALILDEYGSLKGIVTLKDILEAIVGTLPEPDDAASPDARQRPDGSWLIDGLMPIYEAEAVLGEKHMREENDDFGTLAGFILKQLEHVPTEGDTFEWKDFIFEIVDMDGRRVDKVLVKKKED